MSTPSLFQHYVEYLSSPGVLLAILVVVGPIYLEAFRKWKLEPPQTAPKTPLGCFRLGLQKRSNLSDQYQRPTSRHSSIGQDSVTGNARIKALMTYPVKSCSGVELAASEVGATGLKYDRLFTFAQLVSMQDKSKSSDADGMSESDSDGKHGWRFITQREFPRLALLQTELWITDPRAGKKARANGQGKEEASTSPSKRRKGRRQTRDGSPLPQFSSDPKPSQDYAQRLEESWAANSGCLVVRFPYEPGFNPFGLRTETVTMRLPLVPTSQRAEAKKYTSEPISIWRDCPQAINVTNEIGKDALAKLKKFLGGKDELALFRVDERNRRAVTRSLPKDRPSEEYSVDFGDAFPVHLLSLASIRALDHETPKSAAIKGKLDARRFRANIYVTGTSAHAEDSWKKVTMGRCIKPRNEVRRDRSTDSSQPARPDDSRMVETDGEYHVACRTARCKLPNVDPDTGIKDKNEPDTTLRRTRKVDKGAYPHPCLGMQMIPLFQQGILRVGDEIEVLERGEHYYEKMFS